jgi:hypothetical protein
MGEGAERLPTDFYKDLECFCLPSVPIFSMGYDQRHFCHGSGRPDHSGKAPQRPTNMETELRLLIRHQPASTI